MPNIFASKTPLIMGILNITPDSFYDGGKYMSEDFAISQAEKMIIDGANIIDIGGESTRPGATKISVKEEIKRILPIIKAIKPVCHKNNVKISVDTRNSETMEIAIANGADIINDVSALTHDLESINVIARARVPICLMHMKNTPENMQDNPKYKNVVNDVYSYLKSRIEACELAGIDKNLIIADIGIGFGKTLEQNIELFKNLDKFNNLGVPMLLGASRKSFIAAICGKQATPDKRLAGSLAAIGVGLKSNTSIFRVHDVFETKQYIDVHNNIT